MRNFYLGTTGLLIALLYITLEQPGMSISFVVFSILLVENSVRLDGISGSRMLSGGSRQDFRFRYAENYSSLIYGFSLILSFVAYALLRSLTSNDLTLYSLISYGFLFTLFRLGVGDISKYFEGSTTTRTSDYADNLEHRNIIEAKKSALDKLLCDCLDSPACAELDFEIVETRKALSFSSVLDCSVDVLVEDLKTAMNAGDCQRAHALLKNINLKI